MHACDVMRRLVLDAHDCRAFGVLLFVLTCASNNTGGCTCTCIVWSVVVVVVVVVVVAAAAVVVVVVIVVVARLGVCVCVCECVCECGRVCCRSRPLDFTFLSPKYTHVHAHAHAHAHSGHNLRCRGQKTAQMLLDAKANPGIALDESGTVPLFAAVRGGFDDIAKAIIDAGFDVNHTAVRACGRACCARALLCLERPPHHLRMPHLL